MLFRSILHDDLASLRAARAGEDGYIQALMDRFTQADLEACVRYTTLEGETVEARRWDLLTGMFNHQTHHRGQAHALITAAGEQTGDTDLFLVI